MLNQCGQKQEICFECSLSKCVQVLFWITRAWEVKSRNLDDRGQYTKRRKFTLYNLVSIQVWKIYCSNDQESLFVTSWNYLLDLMFLQRCFWILKCYGMPLNGNCLIVTDVSEMRSISIFIVGKSKKSATWPWRCVQYTLPKRRFVIPTRHGVTSQNTRLFIRRWMRVMCFYFLIT